MPSHPCALSGEPDFVALAAIDWADRKHFWSVQGATAPLRVRGELEHTPEAIDAWLALLRSRFGDGPIAVAVEQSRGPLIFVLSKYSQLHLYPIHPRAAAQFRAALFPSGAKDDPVDAELLLDLLVHHRERLRRLDPDTEQTRTLQLLVEERRKLVNEKTRQSNRLTAKLKLYFPQMLDWFDNVDSQLVGELLQRWPTLEAMKRARPDTLRRFFQRHNCRSNPRIQQRVDASRQAIAATHDRAVIASSVAAVRVLTQLIATLREGIAALDEQIRQLAQEHPDFAVMSSFPGAGKVLVPRLIAALGSRRDRYRSAAEVACYSGIAPVQQRSGKSQWVHFRWACPKFLRQTFHEWAGHSIAFSSWARDYYQQQRARGKAHHAAVRALALKWIRILYRCWQDSKPYDERAYLATLISRRQPTVHPLQPALDDSMCKS